MGRRISKPRVDTMAEKARRRKRLSGIQSEALGEDKPTRVKAVNLNLA